MSLGELIVRRLLQALPVFLGVTFAVFLLMHITPGDPVEIMMGQGSIVSKQDINQIRHELGLDRPFIVQYGLFLDRLAHGNLGYSIIQKTSVVKLIGERLPATIELTLISLIISLLISIPVGIISAIRRHSVIDNVGRVTALLGVSMPGFWLGLMLITILSVLFKVLPVSGRVDFVVHLHKITGFYLLDALITGNWDAFWNVTKHLIMPAITLGSFEAAITMRVTRSSMLDVLTRDYMRTAKAKGLPNRLVIIKHGLRNALIPTVTVVALNIGSLLGGNMIVEVVFGWPGMGRLVVNSVFMRDYPLVQGCVLIYAVVYIFANLAADISYAVLDPRIRY